jgi:hypothetical protein
MINGRANASVSTAMGVLIALALGGFMAACSETPVIPAPTKVTPVPPPGPGITLSGALFEVLPDGTRHPVSGRQVDVEVEVDNPNDPQRGGWVPVGADGRYRVSGVPDGRFVKINAVDTGSARQYRLCATNTITRGDTELDIALFLPGAAVPTPTLSGQVSAVIDGKQVPVAGADVYFRSRAFGPDVQDRSDSDGRYSLCGIPSIPGELYMVCGNDVTPYRRSADIRVDTVIDIDATTFYRCLESTPSTAAPSAVLSPTLPWLNTLARNKAGDP